jgi:hypothetical protein
MKYEVKLFEVRDVATYIPVVATRIDVASFDVGVDAQERSLLLKTGWSDSNPALIVSRLGDGKGQTDPYSWKCSTMTVAHSYIAAFWHTLESGDVIDAEFIRGETDAKKVPDRLSEVAL